MQNSTFNQISEETKTKLAVQFVIMDAMEKGHVNKSGLIEYMKSETFANAVKSYKANF